MKRLLATTLVLSPFLIAPAMAFEAVHTITDSVSLTVDAGLVQTERIGTSYGVSGTNIEVTELGGLTGGTATAAATMTAGDYDIKTDGQAFTFNESLTIGDTPVTSQTASGGTIAAPTLFGTAVTQHGGSAGDLAGTLSPTGISSITSGGPGTTGVAQRTVELTVFD